MSSPYNMYRSIFSSEHVELRISESKLYFEYKDARGAKQDGIFSSSVVVEHLGEERKVEDPWVFHTSAKQVMLGYLDVISEDCGTRFVIRTDYLNGGMEALFLVTTREVKRGRATEAKIVENIYLVDYRLSQGYKLVSEQSE